MGLYNILFGQSNNADKLLELLGLSRDDFYRYRDCYLSEDGEIAVYTRGGGGNRECYYCELSHEDEDKPEKHNGDCVVHIQNRNKQHPLYLRDTDDDYDRTYATFYFKVPDGVELDTDNESEINRDELWRIALDALKAANKNKS